jgi:hypothetical protein
MDHVQEKRKGLIFSDVAAARPLFSAAPTQKAA